MANNTEVAKAYIALVPSLGDSRKTIESELGGAGSSGGQKFTSGFSGALKSGLKVVGAAVATVAGAAATGIIAISKQAIDSFAEYEQLAGGVEKIFDQMDYSKIMDDADQAFLSMNMSANEYLSAINNVGAAFSATMGDELAYETAKTGMQAIADYASGTGKNLEELNAKYQMITRSTSSYQSIADQFSGILPATSKDFLEQAQAAGFLADSYKSLTDVPIDEYQQAVTSMLEKGTADLGLAGNTAKEALGTISGSLAATKSAWQNVLTAVAGGGDITKALDNLKTAILGTEEAGGGLLATMKPVIEQTLQGVVDLIEVGIIPMLPDVLAIAIDLLSQLLNVVIAELPGLILQIGTALGGALTSLLEQLPAIADAALQIVNLLVMGLSSSNALGALIQGAVTLVTALANGLAMNLPILMPAVFSMATQIATTLTEPANLEMLLNAALMLIGAVVMGLVASLPQIGELVYETLLNLGELFNDAVQWVAFVGIPAVVNLWNNTLKPFFEKVGKAIGDFFTGIGTSIATWFTQQRDKVVQKLSDIWNSIKAWFTSLPGNISSAFQSTISVISGWASSAVSWGQNLVTGLWNGISDKVSWLYNKISKWVDDVVDYIKDLFGIASPSKVMENSVGKFLAEGIGVGFTDTMKDVSSDMADAIPTSFDTAVNMISQGSIGASAESATGGYTDYGGITLNVYGAEGQSVNDLADAVMDRIQMITDRKAEVYA